MMIWGILPIPSLFFQRKKNHALWWHALFLLCLVIFFFVITHIYPYIMGTDSSKHVLLIRPFLVCRWNSSHPSHSSDLRDLWMLGQSSIPTLVFPFGNLELAYFTLRHIFTSRSLVQWNLISVCLTSSVNGFNTSLLEFHSRISVICYFYLFLLILFVC